MKRFKRQVIFCNPLDALDQRPAASILQGMPDATDAGGEEKAILSLAQPFAQPVQPLPGRSIIQPLLLGHAPSLAL
jgi:hypothetical protein